MGFRIVLVDTAPVCIHISILPAGDSGRQSTVNSLASLSLPLLM